MSVVLTDIFGQRISRALIAVQIVDRVSIRIGEFLLRLHQKTGDGLSVAIQALRLEKRTLLCARNDVRASRT